MPVTRLRRSVARPAFGVRRSIHPGRNNWSTKPLSGSMVASLRHVTDSLPGSKRSFGTASVRGVRLNEFPHDALGRPRQTPFRVIERQSA